MIGRFLIHLVGGIVAVIVLLGPPTGAALAGAYLFVPPIDAAVGGSTAAIAALIVLAQLVYIVLTGIWVNSSACKTLNWRIAETFTPNGTKTEGTTDE
ncbi:hypothetical protein ACFQO4_20720 [Saliphagus sp. GCM10025334]